MASTGRLPSKMEFPETIAAVTAADYPALRETFGLGGEKKNADAWYDRLSSRVVAWTGHEHAHRRDGTPFDRSDWIESISKSLNFLNSELKLGMDRQAIEVMTLCYTVLQESTRFGGDAVIEPRKGENTAVHSLHTMLQAGRIYRRALEKNPELSRNIDFFKSFQATCLMMMVHDLGEMFGEAGSLAQASNAGNINVKDKAALEREVFDYAVRLAVQTVMDGKRSEEEFFKKVDMIKAGLNFQNQGANKTDEEMAKEAQAFTSEKLPLSPRATKTFEFMRKCWEWIEEPKHSEYPYLGYLAAICERVQGTRHLTRHNKTSFSPLVHDNGKVDMIHTNTLMPGYRVVSNTQYSEGHLGWLGHFMNSDNKVEVALTREAVGYVYETMLEFTSCGPKAFFVDPSIKKEARLHGDGSAYTPEEVEQRLKEIALASKVAGMEDALAGNVPVDLSVAFNSSSALQRTAISKAAMMATYQAAIESGYIPGIVTEASGKQRSELIVLDRLGKFEPISAVEQNNIPKTIAKLTKDLR